MPCMATQTPDHTIATDVSTRQDSAVRLDDCPGETTQPGDQHELMIFPGQHDAKQAVSSERGNAKKPSIDEVSALILEATAAKKQKGSRAKTIDAPLKGRKKTKRKKAPAAATNKHSEQIDEKPAVVIKGKRKTKKSVDLPVLGRELGCPKCRWSSGGCIKCRDPKYKPRSFRPC